MRLVFHFLSVFFLLVPHRAKPQALSERDSLVHLVKSLPEDTAKLDVYYQYGFIMENESLDSAAYFYKKAQSISQKYGHVKGLIRFVHNYSFVLNQQGRLDEAYQLNKEGVRLARKHGLDLDLAKSLTNLGNNHNHKGQYDSAMQYYIEAADLFKALNVTNHLNIIYQNISAAFDATEQFEKAIEYGLKSIDYSLQRGDSLTMAGAMVNIGGSLGSLRRYDSALTCFEAARKVSEQIQYAHGRHAALIGIGDVCSKKGEVSKAMAAFREALVVGRRINDPGCIATALNGLAMVLFEKGELTQADEYATEAIAISEKEAPAVFTDLRQQYKLLADIKAKRNQTKLAYHYLERYVTLNDSLSGNDVRIITANLERKYHVAQKEGELARQALRLQQVENNVRRKNALLTFVIGSLALLLAILFLLYRFFRQRVRLQQQEVVSLHQQQEVIRLQSTLEGQQQERTRIAREMHDDIGSGLTSLAFLANALPGDGAIGNKKDRITETIRHMVTQMNEIVWSLNGEYDTLEDLVIYVRHSISEMLETVGIEYQFNIPAEIPSRRLSGAERRHIFLVLKEAVHNSIKHAGATRVTISMDFTDPMRITIEDNGGGITGENRYGNGLKNMQHRMNQVGGKWKLAATKPVKIELLLPLAKAV